MNKLLHTYVRKTSIPTSRLRWNQRKLKMALNLTIIMVFDLVIKNHSSKNSDEQSTINEASLKLFSPNNLLAFRDSSESCAFGKSSDNTWTLSARSRFNNYFNEPIPVLEASRSLMNWCCAEMILSSYQHNFRYYVISNWVHCWNSLSNCLILFREAVTMLSLIIHSSQASTWNWLRSTYLARIASAWVSFRESKNCTDLFMSTTPCLEFLITWRQDLCVDSSLICSFRCSISSC